MKKYLLIVLATIVLSGCSQKIETGNKKLETRIEPTITETPAQTATPTPDMEKLYGPCAKVNVLMFHHIETAEEAKPRNEGSLAVDPGWFRKDMEYLKTKGYNVIKMNDLISFFNGASLPKKSVLITFDDAYRDNYTNMWPILKECGYPATIFVPTGHVNGDNYLTWDEMSEMSSQIYFANHTWSHHSSAGSLQILEKEMVLAETDLTAHGYDANKIFAYPYGKSSGNDETILKKYGFNLAFTTTHGSLMCKGKKFDLPRIRIGNAPLSSYGL